MDSEKRMEQNEDIKRIEAKVDQVLVLLTGNGTPERGIIIRLDRLEQKEAVREKDEAEKMSDVKKFFMPILQQLFSFGAGAVILLIVQHYIKP